MSDLHDGSEGPDAQVLGGIPEDQMQTLPRRALISVHHPPLQFISVRLEHLGEQQLLEHREEPVLERRLESSPGPARHR